MAARGAPLVGKARWAALSVKHRSTAAKCLRRRSRPSRKSTCSTWVKRRSSKTTNVCPSSITFRWPLYTLHLRRKGQFVRNQLQALSYWQIKLGNSRKFLMWKKFLSTLPGHQLRLVPKSEHRQQFLGQKDRDLAHQEWVGRVEVDQCVIRKNQRKMKKNLKEYARR